MPIISEHEVSTGKVLEFPSTETGQVAKLVNELLNRSKRASQDARQEWGSNARFFNGSQWSLQRPMYRFAEVVNLTWSTIMQEVGIQTDTRPKVDFLAAEPSDYDFSELLTQINDQNWQKYNWLQRVQEALVDCKVVHVSHSEIFWNPKLENGVGDIDYKILDPFYCYWDPLAADVDESRWFIYIEPTPTEKLKEKYGKDVKPDIQSYSFQGGQDYRIAVDQDKTRLWYGVQNYRSRPQVLTEAYGGEPMTLLVRCWLKDESIEELAQELENGKKEFVLKKKFPKGRYIEVANDKVLVDGPNGVEINGEIVPYEHGKFPIARLVNYAYPREYCGENEITHLRGPQKIVNYVASYILDVMKKGSAPQKVIDPTAGIEDIDMITDEPGLNIECDPNKIRFEYGPGIPASLFNALDTWLGLLDKVQGIQDSSRGAVQPGVSSGLMLEGFVEASQTRARLKNRNLDQYLRQVGQLMLPLYLQFYTASRTFRMTNQEGFPEFVEFFISQEGEEKVANVGRATLGGAGPQQTKQVIRGVPDVQIQSGSSLPFSKSLKTATAKELFAAGAIDQEALLKALDWPDKDQILERMQQQMQAMAAQGGPGAVQK